MPMTLYISSVGLYLGCLWVLIVTPIVLGLCWTRSTWSGRKRLFIAAVAVFIFAMLPFGDVLVTSYQASKLCKDAGADIRQTVKATGFLTNFVDGATAIGRGFSFLEQIRPTGIWVYKSTDGGFSVEKFGKDYQPKSRYEHRYIEEVRLPESLHISAAKSIVLDRSTGVALAEGLTYRIYPGWVDRNTVQRLQSHAWLCPVNAADIHLKINREVIYPFQGKE